MAGTVVTAGMVEAVLDTAEVIALATAEVIALATAAVTVGMGVMVEGPTMVNFQFIMETTRSAFNI